MVPRSVRFSPEVDAALVERAASERRSVSWLVQEAVAVFLAPADSECAHLPRFPVSMLNEQAGFEVECAYCGVGMVADAPAPSLVTPKPSRSPKPPPVASASSRPPVGAVRCRRCDWWSVDSSLQCPVHEMGSVVR